MADQKNLILKLSLDVDNTNGNKLVSLVKILEDRIKDTVSNTKELQQVEAARAAQAQAIAINLQHIEEAIAYKRNSANQQNHQALTTLQSLIEKNNKALEDGVKWAALIPANIQKAVDKYNSIKQVNDAIATQELASLSSKKLQLQLTQSLLSTEERINAAYNSRKDIKQNVGSMAFASSTSDTRPSGQSAGFSYATGGNVNYGTGGLSEAAKKAKQVEADTLMKADYDLVEKTIANRAKLEEKRDNELIRLYNATANKVAKQASQELAQQEAAKQAEEKLLNDRLSQEQKFSEELNALLNKRQLERDEQIRKQIEKERQLAEQISQIKAGYAQQAIVDNTGIDKTNRDRELSALRSSMEEQHRIRMTSFNNSLSQQEATLRSSIAIQVAEQVHGIQSIEAIRARAAETNIIQEQARQTRLNNITQRVQTGAITPDTGTILAERANQRYAQSLIHTTTELQHHEDATKGVVREHTNLFNRVGQLIGAYTIWNATIMALKSIPNIGIELESTKASLEATTGSAAGMSSVMLGLEQESKRTGIEIGTLRETFRGFQASTSLAGETMDSTWHMFTNLNTVITGLHLPSEKASGIFLAMAQIFNKTKVQSEELVKQLGNLLPGAFASFAAANNVAFGGQFKNSIDLIAQMKKGMVFAHETVERFTQFMADRFEPAFALASNGLNASIGRMKTSFTLLGESIYNMSSGILLSAIHNLESFAIYMRGAVEGTNNFGKVIQEGLLVSLSLLVGLLVKSVGTTIMSTAATIAETNAIAARIAVRRAEAIAAGIQIVATERMTLATAASTIVMEGFKRAAMFLTSPAGILTGLTAIAGGLYLFASNAREASNNVEELLKQSRENLDKVAAKPLTLEMRIDADPEVMKAKKAIADLENTIERAKNITSGGNWIANIINKASLDKDMHNLDEMKRLLIVLQEKAHINVNVENAEALKNIDEIASHFHLLSLQAQGLTEEAAKMQFDITNASKMADLQKQINISEQEKTKEKIIQERYDKLEAERQADAANKTANGTWGKSGFVSKAFSKDEIRTIISQYDQLSLNRASRDQAQKALDEAQIARDNIGIEAQKKRDTDYSNFKLGIQADIYAKGKTLIEATNEAEAKAAQEANKRLDAQAQRIREVQAIKEENRTPAQKSMLADNTQVVADIEKARQATVSNAIDIFNEQQKSKARQQTSDLNKINKDAYKDFGRDITQYAATGKTALDSLDARYAESKVSVFAYYKEKQQIQLETLQKQKELYAQEINFASKSGDSAKIDELRDKITLLDEQIKQVPDLISIDKKKGLDEYNKSLVETAANYQELIGNYQEAERLRFGAIENPKIAKFQAVVEDNTATQEDRVAAKNALLQEKVIQANAGLSRQVSAIQTKIEDINNTYTQKVQLLNTKIATGVESQWSGMLKLRDMNKERIQQLQEQVNLQQQAVQEAKNLAAAATNSSEKDRQLDIAAKTQKQMDESKISLESLKAEGDVVANHFQTVVGDAFQSSFEGLIMGTQTAKQAFTSFATSVVADIAKIVASEIRSQILGKLVGMAFSAIGGYFGSSTSVANGNSASFSSAMSGNNWMTAKVANGGVFSGAGISAHSGSVVSTPTIFPFATGIGLMGEAGPEAILPLKRDSSGKLGVRTTGDKSGQSQGNVYNISVTVQGSKDDKPADTGQKIADVIMRNIAKEEIFKAQRPGNILNKTTNFG